MSQLFAPKFSLNHHSQSRKYRPIWEVAAENNRKSKKIRVRQVATLRTFTGIV